MECYVNVESQNVYKTPQTTPGKSTITKHGLCFILFTSNLFFNITVLLDGNWQYFLRCSLFLLYQVFCLTDNNRAANKKICLFSRYPRDYATYWLSLHLSWLYKLVSISCIFIFICYSAFIISDSVQSLMESNIFFIQTADIFWNFFSPFICNNYIF